MANTIWIKNRELMEKLRITKAIMNFSNFEKLIESMFVIYQEKNKEKFEEMMKLEVH